MRKIVSVICLSLLMGTIMTVFAYAGSWKQEANGWKWYEENGETPKNTWKWIDGDNDGTAECYYFNGDGICLVNSVSPDGYQVNQNGAWILNGIVQTQISRHTVRDQLLATRAPIETGVTIGMPLQAVLDTFMAKGINHTVINDIYYYYDCDGWQHSYTFDKNGFCNSISSGVTVSAEAVANQLINCWQQQIAIPLTTYDKKGTNEEFTYQDNATKTFVGIYKSQFEDGSWFADKVISTW